jgi:hypothetical protein
MSVPTCDHLKEDGVFCGSPALKGRNYCYFHLNLRGRRLKAARARRCGDNPPLNLPFPEDMHSVQLSLAEVMWAIAEDRIETKKAWALLNTLQQASTNLNQTPGWQGKREAVPSSRPLRALNDPHFENRYGLPRDIDLNADPDTIPSDELPGGPQLPSSGNCEDDAPAPEVPTSPDRVPLPEDELRQLNINELEKLEFFVHKGDYDQLTPEQEHTLLLKWLRERRREELEDPALAAERKQFNDEIVALSAAKAAQGSLQLPSSGNCGSQREVLSTREAA